MRAYWRGDKVPVGELSRRLSGSSDLYGASRRGPCASLNYVACHDGFTLHDLVSYESKHNEANGESNRDGNDNNLSRNWGVEGRTDDPEIVALREQIKRNFIASLAFSLGVPMIAAGDEAGRTQQGNNNAYCQDSEITWIRWTRDELQENLLAFTRHVLALRREYPLLRRCTFLRGEPVCEAGIKDVAWLRADGKELTNGDWNDGRRRLLGMLMHRHPDEIPREDGCETESPTLLLVFNSDERGRRFRLPNMPEVGSWTWRVNTALTETPRVPATGKTIQVAARSLALLEYK